VAGQPTREARGPARKDGAYFVGNQTRSREAPQAKQGARRNARVSSDGSGEQTHERMMRHRLRETRSKLPVSYETFRTTVAVLRRSADTGSAAVGVWRCRRRIFL